MSHSAITLKFKMCLFLDEASSWAQTLFTEDNNFGGFLVLDFRKRWRRTQPKNYEKCSLNISPKYS